MPPTPKTGQEAFDQTSRLYMERLEGKDLARVARDAGLEFSGGWLSVPLFGAVHRVGPEGVEGPGGREPGMAVKVLLFRFALDFPDPVPPPGGWAAYRDFPDAAPFVGAFAANVETALARAFSGKPDAFCQALADQGGEPPGESLPYDASAVFTVLPLVPVLALFNDADETLPASCSVLFDRTAPRFLDAECLAMAGWLLADRLMRGLRPPLPELET
ncbi:MAG: DUF3786 domain-containing protein [Proteobacteria bacterium]|nr:DUF3786 domain-containing protein [Pseudomonadota bacterium]